MAHSYYSARAAAKRMDCSEDVLRDAVKAGALRAKRKGDQPRSPLLFRDDWLDDWFENQLPDA